MLTSNAFGTSGGMISKLARFDMAPVYAHSMVVGATTGRAASAEASATQARSIAGGGGSVSSLVVDVQSRDDVHPQSHGRFGGLRASYHGSLAREGHMTLAATIKEKFVECFTKLAIRAGVHVRIADRVGQGEIPNGVEILLRQRFHWIHYHRYNLL